MGLFFLAILLCGKGGEGGCLEEEGNGVSGGDEGWGSSC